MFSLVITIVSIALVAALAVATIYYGGDIAAKASARASAATVVSQGQQILSAVHIFRAHTGRWPNDLNELVSSDYLKSTPGATLASADTSLVSVAHAAVATWGTVQAGQPYYWIHNQVPVEQCQQLNLLVRGDNGIFNAAKPSLPTQCFGSNANYTVIIGVPGATAADMVEAVTEADPSLSVDESGGGYSVPVTATAPVVGGGAPSGGDPVDEEQPATIEPTFSTAFTIPAQYLTDGSYQLTPPVSNSSGTWSYSSSNPAVATIAGNVVTFVSAGSVSVFATQAAAPPYTSKMTSAALVIWGPAREWMMAGASWGWNVGPCYLPWRLPTVAELQTLRTTVPNTTPYYGGWVWTSEKNGQYPIMVNMTDGRVLYDHAYVEYAKMCTK